MKNQPKWVAAEKPSITRRWISGDEVALRIFLALILAIIWLLNTNTVSYAENNKSRVFVQTLNVKAAHWQLVRWQNSQPMCDVYVEGSTGTQPSSADIINYCGTDVFNTWIVTPACPDALAGYGANCKGLFQRYLGEKVISVKKEKTLPGMSFTIEPTTCTLGEWCPRPPRLKIDALEPVRGYQITRLHVLINGREKIFFGSDGELGLPLTGENGNWIEYSADSSFGDESDRIKIKYRSFQPDPQIESYRFDLLSKDLTVALPAASLIWNIFSPAVSSLPNALQETQTAADLHTSRPLIYLAGHLIQTGQVNAFDCQANGLLSNGSATTCGLGVAYQKNADWQNKYDNKIITAAHKYNVPARVIKGIIAQETQFWPISDSPYELGLGKITDNGVDMLLMWNTAYFLSTCVPIYSEITCSAGYSNLAQVQQNTLRSIILKKAEGDDQIDILAAILVASAAQTNQMLVNTIQTEPENAVSYEDMWRITIGNYNAGSGCISVGMKTFQNSDIPITWEKLVDQMAGNCKDTKNYVDKVFEFSN